MDLKGLKVRVVKNDGVRRRVKNAQVVDIPLKRVFVRQVRGKSMLEQEIDGVVRQS